MSFITPTESPLSTYHTLRKQEITRRLSFKNPIERSADKYLVKRGSGKTIIAGYPWFSDWGRDTLIAIRGLCLSTGRLIEPTGILLEWARSVSDGMLPNFFPDAGQVPEYNSVDAALWFVIAVHDLHVEALNRGYTIPPKDSQVLHAAVQEILAGYHRGTRYGIRCDQDGLLACGEPGVQLTWMDAKIGDWVVTPRIGKPVDIQALWLNSLWIGSEHFDEWSEVFEKGMASFEDKFWNPEKRMLFDVVDEDHVPGKNNSDFRPNQILAIGGLPLPILSNEKATQVLQSVYEQLWTPMGLRSLSPEDPGYRPFYEGDFYQRDSAYHQGTVWPWLMGPFIEAWVRVHGEIPETIREARVRFLNPLLDHLEQAGLGHVSEITDADPPHNPRGCPFQAWSLAELIRVQKVLDSLKSETESRTKPVMKWNRNDNSGGPTRGTKSHTRQASLLAGVES